MAEDQEFVGSMIIRRSFSELTYKLPLAQVDTWVVNRDKTINLLCAEGQD